MSIRFFNTLTRKEETFEPITPGEVKLYTCGPTVYNYAHIGNFRTFLFEDLLKRHLKYRGFKVFHVMNLTDVEDKIIRQCRETGEPLKALTERYTKAFFEDLETLRVQHADLYPAATEHIDDIVALIKALRERGHTYEMDGNIYFRLSTFPQYGQLSQHDISQLQQGASGRVDADEYETEDARDFALWKAWDEEDGDVYWETELGKGRPGWHIECSCMSMKYLGETFDLHCGGVDLVFPHHENEIAQSEAATGRPFVKYWLHGAHLRVEGQKMSKSLGNTYTLRDLLAQGHDPLAIRYALMGTHYRQPNNFTFAGLEAAKQALQRIRDFRTRMAEIEGPGSNLTDEIQRCEESFGAALDDDLNISGALAAVFEFVRDVNRLADTGGVGEAGAKAALGMLDRLDAVAGVFAPAETEAIPEEIHQLVLDRQQARRDRDFARADAIRERLRDAGWLVEDTPDGPRVKKA